MNRDNEFFDRLDGGAASSPIGTTLGWELVSVKPDEGTIEIVYSADDRFLNPFGLVQGGILGSMLDDTLGSVMISVLDRGQIAPTTDLHIQFLRRPGPAASPAAAGSCGAERASRSCPANCRTPTTAWSPWPQRRPPSPGYPALSGKRGEPVAVSPGMLPVCARIQAMKRDNEFWDAMEPGGPVPGAAKTLGWELLSADPDAGTVEVAFNADDRLLNPAGVVQGGFVAAMLDDTLGPALVSTLERGQFAPTADLHVQFLRPARPGRLTGRGRIVRRGKNIAFLSGELSDETGKVVAVATATAMIQDGVFGKS